MLRMDCDAVHIVTQHACSHILLLLQIIKYKFTIFTLSLLRSQLFTHYLHDIVQINPMIVIHCLCGSMGASFSHKWL